VTVIVELPELPEATVRLVAVREKLPWDGSGDGAGEPTVTVIVLVEEA